MCGNILILILILVRVGLAGHAITAIITLTLALTLHLSIQMLLLQWMLKKADKTTEITLSNKPSILYEGHGNLYLNITNRCTMDCTFCIRNFTDGVYGYNLKLEHEPSVDEVIDALSGCRLEKYSEFVFTGFGEPLIRFDDVISIIRWLKENGCRVRVLSLIHISEPTRLGMISYAVFCLKKKK